jgi:hypothetical protein
MVLLLAAPAASDAQQPGPGYYRVESCRASDTRGAGFGDFATRDMVIKRGCTPYGKGVRGLVVSVKHSGKKSARVKRGSVARLIMAAPAGTVITRTAWSGGAVRSDCGYDMNVYAQNTGANRTWPLFDTNKCPPPGRAQSSGDRREVENNISANRIVLRMICKDSACSRRGKNYLRTSSLAAGIVDVQDPTVAITSAPQGWTNGTQTIGYTANDNTGLKTVAGGRESDSFGCALITTTPCPRQVNDSLQINTNGLGEGTQQLALSATDVGGRGGASAPVPVRVDFTPPGRVDTAVAGGEGWRSSTPFSVGWTNPGEGDRAPIVAARYQLCPVGDSSACKTERVAGDGIAATSIQPPSPGAWTVRTWREDAAGNQSDSQASNPVTVRWDPTPPEVAFGPSSPTDPTQVNVRAADSVSGVASSSIELSREGSGTWQQVPASQSGDKLTGRIDDSELPAGRYQLRARAVDQAGNEKSAQGATVQLPLRIATNMRAGRAHTKVVRKKVRRKGKRRMVKRRKTTFRPSTRIGYRRSKLLRGTLTNREGNPITGPVAVYEQSEITPSHVVGSVSANAKGRFQYRASGTQSRTLTFVYRGDGIRLPVSSQVKISVPAKASIKTSRKRLLNGGQTRFSGLVRTRPVPVGGKLVAIQAYIKRKGAKRGRWSTFRTLRTDANGRWATRYRFVSTCERRFRYSIRAIVPREAGVPYSVGASRPTHVTVRGNGSC